MSLQNRLEPMFGGKSAGSKQGVGYPKMSGISPIVTRADSRGAILPKGMDSGVVVDGSTGGEDISFQKMGIGEGM